MDKNNINIEEINKKTEEILKRMKEKNKNSNNTLLDKIGEYMENISLEKFLFYSGLIFFSVCIFLKTYNTQVLGNDTVTIKYGQVNLKKEACSPLIYIYNHDCYFKGFFITKNHYIPNKIFYIIGIDKKNKELKIIPIDKKEIKSINFANKTIKIDYNFKTAEYKKLNQKELLKLIN